MTTSPSKAERYIEEVFAILDRDSWGTIDWDGDDRFAFTTVLREAWARTDEGQSQVGSDDYVPIFAVDPDHVATICPRCGQPFTYPEGCTPDECREGK